jgi:hypothetical protein
MLNYYYYYEHEKMEREREDRCEDKWNFDPIESRVRSRRSCKENSEACTNIRMTKP